MRYQYGEQKDCKYCGQDIQNNGNRQWVDRGGNRGCCPYIKNGEVIKPKTKHSPEAYRRESGPLKKRPIQGDCYPR